MTDQPTGLSELAARYVNTTNHHIFLTGKAGTGKTTFLKYIVDHTYKKCAVAAPTGIAAINAGGVTLHSLLQLPFGVFVPDPHNTTVSASERINNPKSVLSGLKWNSTKRKLIREIELLIIDEVSMLRADLLDCIDTVLRSVRRSKSVPFGGLQILFIGDLMQLPPVVRDDEKEYLSPYYNSSYFFEALALKEKPPVYIELDKIYRQNDQSFIEILNNLRNNQLTDQDIKTLNDCYQKDYALDETIFITTHNHKADKINQAKLSEIKGTEFSYTATISDDFRDNLYPTALVLQLKIGAQVMFMKNDISGEGRYFNGKIGKVTDLEQNKITVVCDGVSIDVDLYEWENKRYKLNTTTNEVEEKIIGSFKQYPLKLAWAATVHKSQGLTFEKAVLDISGVFAPGQIYVALSRLTSLAGLTLASPIPDNIIESEDSVVEFSKQRKIQEDLKLSLKKDQREFIKISAQAAFDFSQTVNEISYHLSSFQKDENRSIKQQYASWTNELITSTQAIAKVGSNFKGQISEIVEMNENYLPILQERIQKALAYFKPLIEVQISTISDHLADLKVKKKVKGYTKEVDTLRDLFIKQQYLMERISLLISETINERALTKEKLRGLVMTKPNITKKEAKVPTAEISLGLYKDGLSLDQIAEKRGMVSGTISGHLSQYVEKGVLDVLDFLDSKKLEQILIVIEKTGVDSFGTIKSKLGDEFSYGDVKFAVSHFKSIRDRDHIESPDS